MYKSHPLLKEPKKEALLWRYMDFTKFFALLETESLFFPRLTSLEDLFEGHPPKSVIDAYLNQIRDADKPEFEERIKLAEHNINVLRDGRGIVCVSCWHNNPSESAAMWNLYIKQGEGIAICTTFERFKEAISDKNKEINGGLVEYVDYDTYSPSQMNHILWAILKRQSFEHEREFRGVLLDLNTNTSGVNVEVNLDILIDKIYLSPATPGWISSLLGKMLGRYGLSKKIIPSTLMNGPGYYEP